ncbi:hypothetical protein VUJ46_18530 [Chryseobacterium sp. MYb264]|uniref:hypothetical protein n=1 Tax=Chryseobacterium sp. MYb264 TaxID=2745153 RepID=UPI002E0F2B34|nr:hypothetical protein VUJ46_18530 [Chryseobacterium sp. MYb264]
MKRNAPNLFRSETSFFIHLDEKSSVTITFYAENGTKIRTILNQQELSEGRQEIRFSGNHLKQGVYQVKIIIENSSGTSTENRILQIN